MKTAENPTGKTMTGFRERGVPQRKIVTLGWIVQSLLHPMNFGDRVSLTYGSRIGI